MWYKVIILNIQVMDSAIEDEKHFSLKEEAENFAAECKNKGYYPLIVEFGSSTMGIK